MSNFKKIRKNMKLPRVLLVRHGHTDMNNVSDKSEDRIRGWIDVPLNDEGRKDALKAEKQLKKVPIDIFFSSDLIRARETADIINRVHKKPIVDAAALRPWNLGIFQGKRTSDVIDKVNKHIENPNIRVPDGETFQEFNDRYIGLLNRIITQAIQDKQVIVVTTHLRNLKLADGWVQNGMPRDFSVDHDVVVNDEFNPGEIFEIPIDDYLKTRKQ